MNIKKIIIAGIAAVFGFAVLAAPNFVRPSGTIAWLNTGAAVAGGQIVDLGDRYGVALADIASNATGTVQVDGIWKFARVTTNSISAGTALYYSTATSVTVVVSSDKFIGACASTLAAITTATLTSSVSYVEVDLNAHRRPIGLASGTISTTGTATIVEGEITAAN